MDKNKSFFKIMMNDFRNRLRIPKRFVTSFKNSNKLLGRKFLTGPCGKTCLVEVKRTEEDDFVFCNGWEIFVKDHHLDDADLLVFKMDGFSGFDVTIFDPSACEKEEPSSEDDPSCEEINYGYDDDDDDTTDEEDNIQEVTSRKSSHGKQYQFHSPQPSKGRKKKKILVAKEDNKKRKCTPEENSCSYSNRRQVPEKEKMRVHQQASRHTSSVPCVLMKMKPTHVYNGQLKFPRAWAQEHMRQKSETITLRIPSTGRTWPASIRCRMEGLVIQSGWEDFVMDNRLDEFDVCVFELALGGKHNSIPVILDVHIYPVKNEIIGPL
ncbi:hypothetical protein T459_06661 [Capsicum annuum]|uniref:TF-B3 domain-containing protein n=1 Tax=Capsicum annuum TaxID=4072 RepID=A0A1U8FXL3_CAPAN|nr:B3 domain-containing protein LOC_Os12g40080 isoform X1 [Capsicum annuum]PHT91548.1 hypothetical protein T459_06661 [Capsicum annuum]